MAVKRTVECQDCGHRWDSSASSPRCSKAACGRSRNVQPLEDVDEDDGADVDEQDGADDLELNDEPAEPETIETDGGGADLDDDRDDQDDEQDADPSATDDESSGYQPRFKSRTNRVDVEDDQAAPPTPSLEAVDGADDRDDGADEQDGAEADVEDEPEDEIPELDPEDLEPMMDVAFSMVASRRGEHWNLEDGESERLAAAWCPVANKYAPHLMKEHYAVTVAGLATVAILKPRIDQDREIAKREEASERDTEARDVEQTELSFDALEDEQTTEQTDEQPVDGGYAAV